MLLRLYASSTAWWLCCAWSFILEQTVIKRVTRAFCPFLASSISSPFEDRRVVATPLISFLEKALLKSALTIAHNGVCGDVNTEPVTI